MLRMIYSLVCYCLVPFVIIRLLWRSMRQPEYRQRMGERFALSLPLLEQSIWVHAVSVGEVIAVSPLLEMLKAKYPEHTLVVTTTTPTGSAELLRRFPEGVAHVYAPYDLPDCVNRFLRATKPALALFVETELWPNIITQCKKANIPSLLINARLSERSAIGYQRFSWFVRPMMQNLTAVAAQTNADSERFMRFGLSGDRVKVLGNMKYDLALPDDLQDKAAELRELIALERPVFIAASTHAGEEKIVLEAFAKVSIKIPNALMLLVPRHPDRFKEIAQLCVSEGFATVTRSSGDVCTADTAVYLGDTMGELLLFYAASDVVFVGGSLVENGGHNFMEPAALGKALLSGPSLFNFNQISHSLIADHALVVVDDAEMLASQVIDLLQDKKRAQEMAKAALIIVENSKGALQKHIDLISEYVE